MSQNTKARRKNWGPASENSTREHDPNDATGESRRKEYVRDAETTSEEIPVQHKPDTEPASADHTANDSPRKNEAAPAGRVEAGRGGKKVGEPEGDGSRLHALHRTCPTPENGNGRAAERRVGRAPGESEASAHFPQDQARLPGVFTKVARAVAWKLFRAATGDGPVPESSPVLSPEELEERLKLALRETSVGGFSRIGVGSPKGGVGKSSIAYSLASAIAYYTNLRVCLVDADPNFGSTRLLVPRPVDRSVVELASCEEWLERLSDLRRYVAQNEQMRLDVLLNPAEAARMAHLSDLGEAYERIDAILSRFYDLVIYDLGLGFRDPAIRRVLSLSDELLFVSDGEVIPNAQLTDAIRYVENLGVDLSRTTLALNHRLPPTDESADSHRVRAEHASSLRRITEIPYDAAFSQLLNRRAFHVEELSTDTRLGVLTTAAAVLEGLRRDEASGEHSKVVSPEIAERKGA